MTADFVVLERLMSERRSERNFGPDDVDDATVRRILEAAATAPSASNRQQYRFMVVRQRETLRRMVEAVSQAAERALARHAEWLADGARDYSRNFLHFADAPVVIGVLFRFPTDAAHTFAEPACETDSLLGLREGLSSAAAAIMQLLLAAHALGLGACWMTGPCLAEAELLKLLRAPHGWRLAALVPLGQRAGASPHPKRRKLEQLLIPEPYTGDQKG